MRAALAWGAADLHTSQLAGLEAWACWHGCKGASGATACKCAGTPFSPCLPKPGVDQASAVHQAPIVNGQLCASPPASITQVPDLPLRQRGGPGAGGGHPPRSPRPRRRLPVRPRAHAGGSLVLGELCCAVWAGLACEVAALLLGLLALWHPLGTRCSCRCHPAAAAPWLPDRLFGCSMLSHLQHRAAGWNPEWGKAWIGMAGAGGWAVAELCLRPAGMLTSVQLLRRPTAGATHVAVLQAMVCRGTVCERLLVTAAADAAAAAARRHQIASEVPRSPIVPRITQSKAYCDAQ